MVRSRLTHSDGKQLTSTPSPRFDLALSDGPVHAFRGAFKLHETVMLNLRLGGDVAMNIIKLFAHKVGEFSRRETGSVGFFAWVILTDSGRCTLRKTCQPPMMGSRWNGLPYEMRKLQAEALKPIDRLKEENSTPRRPEEPKTPEESMERIEDAPTTMLPILKLVMAKYYYDNGGSYEWEEHTVRSEGLVIKLPCLLCATIRMTKQSSPISARYAAVSWQHAKELEAITACAVIGTGLAFRGKHQMVSALFRITVRRRPRRWTCPRANPLEIMVRAVSSRAV